MSDAPAGEFPQRAFSSVGSYGFCRLTYSNLTQNRTSIKMKSLGIHWYYLHILGIKTERASVYFIEKEV